jgi:hypothetical protein
VSEIIQSNLIAPEAPENSRQILRAFATRDRVAYSIYALTLVASISLWLIAIGAPLRVDETGTIWLINGGLSGIWARQFIGLAFPIYQYILWFSTKLIGTSELALRIPSVLAMLGATYVLYLAVREFLGREIGFIAVIIFSLNSTVAFASIDVRPYAFAVLVTNSAILVLFRSSKSDSNWLAVWFGLLSALIVYFHYLFGTILPALLVCFIVFKYRNRKLLWRQLGIALSVFAMAFLPLIPGLRYLFGTAGSHIVPTGAGPLALIRTLIPYWLAPAFAVTAFVAALLAAAGNRPKRKINLEGHQTAVCISLALVPTLILFGITFGMLVDVFSAPYHRLCAVPGISMCWAILISRFSSRTIRLLFCLVYMGLCAWSGLFTPASKQHDYSWKYALEATEKNASTDNAPVVICSNFIEADYEVMPTDSDSAKASKLFAPLTYYKLSGEVVPLPEGLNQQTVLLFSSFLKLANLKHERFLVVGHSFSYAVLDWIVQNTSDAYEAHSLGIYDGVKVLEFTPRNEVTPGAVDHSPPNHGGER